jgi:hypothetical protein
MKLVPRLSLRLKLVALVLMGGLLAMQPLLDARRRLAAADAPAGGILWSVEGQNPLVDRLLPEGVGGTVFYSELGGYAGMAFQGSSTVGVALDVGSHDIAGVELHERAHLLEFARPDVVARLMRGQPAPAPGQYAATNPVEHFAETAAKAWEVVELLTPVDFCRMDSLSNILRRIERDVPGTAGFVLWYLRNPVLAAAEDADALRKEAERLVADRRADWEPLYAALRDRQLPDGGFPPWPRYSVREYLERRRAHIRLAGGVSARIEAAQITASLSLLNLAGR